MHRILDRSIGFSKDVCYYLPISRVKGVKGDNRWKFRQDYTLVIEVQGGRNLKIHFFDAKKRDEAVENVLQFIEVAQERHRVDL